MWPSRKLKTKIDILRIIDGITSHCFKTWWILSSGRIWLLWFCSESKRAQCLQLVRTRPDGLKVRSKCVNILKSIISNSLHDVNLQKGHGCFIMSHSNWGFCWSCLEMLSLDTALMFLLHFHLRVCLTESLFFLRCCQTPLMCPLFSGSSPSKWTGVFSHKATRTHTLVLSLSSLW